MYMQKTKKDEPEKTKKDEGVSLSLHVRLSSCFAYASLKKKILDPLKWTPPTMKVKTVSFFLPLTRFLTRTQAKDEESRRKRFAITRCPNIPFKCNVEK